MRKAFSVLFVMVFAGAFIFGISAGVNADSGLVKSYCTRCYTTISLRLGLYVKECCIVEDYDEGVSYEECTFTWEEPNGHIPYCFDPPVAW